MNDAWFRDQARPTCAQKTAEAPSALHIEMPTNARRGVRQFIGEHAEGCGG